MKEYLEIVENVLKSGLWKQNRTETRTLTNFGILFQHSMKKGFPLLTTKKMPIKLIASELEFFIKGITDKRWLQQRNNHIWDDWANPKVIKEKYFTETTNLEDILNKIHKDYLQDKELMDTARLKDLQEKIQSSYSLEDNVWKYNIGSDKKSNLIQHYAQYVERDLGPIYGWQWRNIGAEYKSFETNYQQKGFDQLANVIELLEKNPNSRRMLVTAWSPNYLDQMALPPCHYSFQLDVIQEKIHLEWNQRSVDTMLGLPFNIASYGLLLELFALQSNYSADKLIGNLGDVHIYENHIEGAKKQLEREPFTLPRVQITDFKNIFDWTYDSVKIHDYKSYERINLSIAV